MGTRALQLLGLLGGLVALGTCSSQPMAPDGGLDGGASLDSSDAPPRADGPRDSPDALAPTDGWTHLLGTWPDWCRLEWADDELVASTHFPITPCSDRSGCRELLVTWPGPPPSDRWAQPMFIAPGHGHHDGLVGHFVLRRDVDTEDTEQWLVDDAGNAELGFRSDRPVLMRCMSSIADASSARFATRVGYGGPGAWHDYLIEVTPDRRLVFSGDIAASTPGVDAIQDLRTSDVATGVHLNSFVLLRITEAGGTEEVYSDGTALGTLRAVIGETLIFTIYDGVTNDVRVAPGSGAGTTLAAAGRRAYSPSSDGVHIAWLEWDSNSREGRVNLDVMISPYAETPAGLVPRSLERFALADLQDTGVGHGYVAYQLDAEIVHLYRIADGATAVIVAPAGEWWWGPPAYLGPEEVAVAAGPNVTSRAHRRLMFIRYDALAWSVP